MEPEKCKLVPLNTFLKIRNDKIYEEALEASSKFNKQLGSDRKLRIPFIDSQTRVAQSNCLLWYAEYQRSTGTRSGQLVSYPVKKWYKKQRRFLDNNSVSLPVVHHHHHHHHHQHHHHHHLNENSNNSMDSMYTHAVYGKQSSMTSAAVNDDFDYHKPSAQQSAVNSNNNGGGATNNGTASAAALDDWHHHDDTFEQFDANDDDSDGDDYEDSRKRKSKKGQSNRSSTKPRRAAAGAASSAVAAAAAALTDDDKPYVCERCGMRYKTKPGLSYHMHKTHGSTTSKPSEVINADENANSVFDSVYEDSQASNNNMANTAVAAQNACSNSGLSNNTNQPANGTALPVLPKLSKLELFFEKEAFSDSTSDLSSFFFSLSSTRKELFHLLRLRTGEQIGPNRAVRSLLRVSEELSSSLSQLYA